MKILFVLFAFTVLYFIPAYLTAQPKATDTIARKATGRSLYIDVHQLEPGKVKFEDVEEAHQKDLAIEKKYAVQFIKYWIDENKGLVYCLSSSGDSESIRKTHAEAHGLLPDHIYKVTDGQEVASNGPNDFFLDVHYLGEGKVTANDVAAAHKKDLAVEKKYGVNFINYWVDEKEGVVVC